MKFPFFPHLKTVNMNLLFLIRDLLIKKPIPENWKGVKISKTIQPTNQRKYLQDFPVNSAQL